MRELEEGKRTERVKEKMGGEKEGVRESRIGENEG